MQGVKAPTATRLIFAENLRRARLRTPLSQERLAELAGLDRTYISSLERLKYNVTIDNIHRIAAALGMEPYQLLMPTDSEPPLQKA